MEVLIFKFEIIYILLSLFAYEAYKRQVFSGLIHKTKDLPLKNRRFK
jgi:hypothetical protein